ncbi:MAG: YifB family Mg chelatase-like AAA ATPase [Candidatus Ornithomonoglobus sp.]
MFTKVNTVSLSGLDGFIIDVQTDISNGMVSSSIIGLPNATVRESLERAKASIRNSGADYPRKKITINLAPADIPKEGSGFDLAITLSILEASGQMHIDDPEHTIFLGELALDGTVNPIHGVLPMVISAYEHGFTKCFVPEKNAKEAAVIEGVEVYPVSSLSAVLDHFDGISVIEPFKAEMNDYLTTAAMSFIDMQEVKGQETAKRAMEVAASGSHNILMSGSAGTGKSMLARRLSTILPDMTFDEMLEVTKLHSIAGTLPADTPLITQRPFRSPHHTVSANALSGGGVIPRPGELSLSHCGVLFLDELPEFRRDTLEVLRQPLEDGVITISRVNATLTYPCNIMLVAAMNPCPCGNLNNPNRQCTCSQNQIQRYRAKISGPLLDRIDIQIDLPAIKYEDISALPSGDSSAAIKERVNKARKIQTERYKDENITSNSQLSSSLLDKYCRLGESEDRLLHSAYDRLGLSARAHGKILKVARTIADLDGSDDIKSVHLAEAIQYRSMDRKNS